MRLNTVLVYILSKIKEETKEKFQRDYNSNRLYEIVSLTYKANWNKDLKLKAWSDIEKQIDKPQEKTKTAREIEKDIIKKFEKWR